jgi:hypothetical protein
MKAKYKKFASKMREDLYRNFKLLSVAEGKSIQTLLEESVSDYLSRKQFSREKMMIGEREVQYSVSFVSEDKKEKPKK